VHFDVRGNGRKSVIFVHGGFGSSAELWHRTMDALPSDFTGYAIDNFLRSEAPPDGYNVHSFAKRLGHFAAELGLAKPIIVGHSMGGVVCQLAALSFPETFGGMVLIGTGPTMRNHGLGQQLLDRMKAEGVTKEMMRDFSAHWFYQPAPGNFFEEYVSRAQQAPAQAIIDAQASLLEVDLVDQLGTIAIPTLIVHGAHDHGRPIEHAKLLLNGIRNSRLCVCEESGHSPMLETPSVFDKEFHAFLTQVS
jgi:pimeloyl-ACP methyl ester carboxylesterase